MNSSAEKKRIGIYIFNDIYGVADRYVDYFLQDFSRNVDTLIIAANGNTSFGSLEKFKKYSQHIVTSEKNTGFINLARSAVKYINRSGIQSYDEIILTNSDIYGPLASLKNVLSCMDVVKSDFWGIAEYSVKIEEKYVSCPYPFFLVFEKAMLKTELFWNYWNEASEIKDKDDNPAVYFLMAGFRYETFCKCRELREYTSDPLRFYPLEMIENFKCPFIPREIFTIPRLEIQSNLVGPLGRKVLDYLDKNGTYDSEMILENLIRTSHMIDLVNNLNLVNVLPCTDNRDITFNPSGLLLVLNLYYADRADYYLRYARSMPAGSEVLIVSGNRDIVLKAKQLADSDTERNYKITDVVNRGRDISAVLVAAREEVLKHEIICIMHDKKSSHTKPGSVGLEWGKSLLNNLLKNTEMVNNIINLFERQSRLGLLVPMPPAHGLCSRIYNDMWSGDYAMAADLLKDMNVHVPVDINKDPVAGFGSCYWFRKKALQKLFERKWSYEDFPPEPLPKDGTILHAIERSLPFFAQEKGYLTEIVIEKEEAENEILTLNYYLRDNAAVDSNYVHYLEQQVQEYYRQTSLKWQLRHRFKKLLHNFTIGHLNS